MTDATDQHLAARPASSALVLGEYQLGLRQERRSAVDVYEAWHLPSGAARLVYVLHAAAAADHPFVHRVVCEVDAARWLRHPASVRVEAHGPTPTGGVFVAVERPAGRTLEQLLASGERVGRRRLVRLGSRLAEALEEAHAVGLVHGRLTPDRVFVSAEPGERDAALVALTGLGVAAVALDGPAAEAERPYVSPERLSGRDPDARSDVYGLASLLHLLLVGAPPAESSHADDAAAATRAEYPSAMAVVTAARAADPGRRHDGVKAFWEDFVAALVDDVASTAAPATVPASAGAPRASDAVAVKAALEEERRRAFADLRREPARGSLLSTVPLVPGPWADPSAPPTAGALAEPEPTGSAASARPTQPGPAAPAPRGQALLSTEPVAPRPVPLVTGPAVVAGAGAHAARPRASLAGAGLTRRRAGRAAAPRRRVRAMATLALCLLAPATIATGAVRHLERAPATEPAAEATPRDLASAPAERPATRRRASPTAAARPRAVGSVDRDSADAQAFSAPALAPIDVPAIPVQVLRTPEELVRVRAEEFATRLSGGGDQR